MKKKNVIKLIALLLTFAIAFTTIPIVAMAKQTSVDGEKPAYIVGEIESMRTETEKVFRMSDGKMQMAVYNTPVHFENEDGEWEQINNKLKSQDSDTYTTKNTAQDISLSKKYKSGKTVEITTNDTNISWGFVGANKASAEIVEQETEELEGDEKFTTIPNAVSTTIYEEIYDNIDAEYIITGGQVKENLILNKETNQNEFEIEYRYKKLTPVQKDDKTIELQNSKGKTVYTITAPIMTDDKGAFSDDLKLEIVSNKNNKLTVKLIVDEKWLQDKDRDYPVTIDPSVEYIYNDSYCGFSCAANYDIPEYGPGYYCLAYNEVEQKSAIIATFQHIPTLSKGSYITNVEFHIPRISVSGDLNIHCLGESNVKANYTWEEVSNLINNKYPESVYVSGEDYDVNWNITRTYQQYYKNDVPFSYAITATTGYAEMIIDKTFSYTSTPVLSLTYFNQFGIKDKYSYHQFNVLDAGTVYLNDSTGSYTLKRNDATIKTLKETINFGMYYRTSTEQYIWDFNNHYYSWNTMYHEKIIKGTDYLVLRKDDGSIYYFNYPENNDKNYYADIDGQDDFKLSVVGDNNYKVLHKSTNMIYEYTSYGYNEFNYNEEVYLTNIYRDDTDVPFLNFEYNNLTEDDLLYLFDDLRNVDSESKTISKITDELGYIYNYAYHSDYALLLTSITCPEQNINLSYTYNSDRWLSSVKNNDNITANYEYVDFETSYLGTQYLSEIIDTNNYKIKLGVNAGRINSVEEYGYDSESNQWVQGSRLSVSRYPAKTIYYQLDEQNEATYSEIYRFDKNGYLASVFNGDGYAINQNVDQEGNVFANTEITIPVVNLANDSSFEKSTSVWALTNASVQTKSETVNNAYFGNNWLEINNTSFATAKASQTVTGLSKGTYTFSAYVKTAENSKIELNENNTIYDGVSIRATVGETTKKATGISGEYGDWTRVYVTFDVAENNSSANIELGLYNAKGNIYVDAVQLEKHKRAYDYNAVENADFSNNSAWSVIDGTVEYDANVSNVGYLDSNALKITNGIIEQEVYLSNVSDASISAWVSTVGMTATDEDCKISVVGYNVGQSPITLAEKDIDFCLSASADNEISFYKVMMPINTKTTYDNYKIKIEYNCPYGYMLIDGIEVMNGAMNIVEAENDTTTDTETDTETEVTEDYQIEDGYTVVSIINNFDTYTGNINCNYLVNGTVVNKTTDFGDVIKDVINSTAYLGNSWGVTQSKDKYEYKDSTGATKTTGGIWIGGKLDKTTQSGIRFWYKSSASCAIQLRSATYGKGGTYDYIKTLPAAPKGTWVTLLYKDIETTKRKITDFKYLFMKTSTSPVYVDEVQTVLQDTIIYDDIEYNISEITQEENGNYPVIDEYIYSSGINNFNFYQGEFGYLVNGSRDEGTAYCGNSWGVTQNVDKYEQVDEDNNETHLSYGIIVGSFDSSKDGIRFWYKSEKECQVSLREQFYGISETDYKVTLPAAPNGDWYTILFHDVKNAGKNLSDYYCIFVKTGSSPSVYIDELHYVVLDEEYYSVTESYETSRDGQVMKTVNSYKFLTLNNKLCTINKETNSLGVNTFTITEDETGNLISTTDGNGNKTEYTYDYLNNLVQINKNTKNYYSQIRYSYDIERNIIQSASTQTASYWYDYTPFGDLESISVGNTSLLTYTYESNQNRVVTKVAYANGQSINYSYNDLGMLTQEVNKDGNNVINTLSYVNDETGETIKTIDSENATVTLIYLNEVQIWNYNETEILYSYSLDADNFDEFVNGTKFTTTYSETDDTDTKTSLTTTETTAFGDMTKTVYSDTFGRVIKEETKNGDTVVLTKEYEYTSNGKYTTEQIKSVKTTVGSSTPETIRYTYDNNGNITGIYSKVGNNTETTIATYEYNEFNEVVKENNKSYVYDNYGNIISAGNNLYSYSTGECEDQLTSFNGNTITYDECGNPINYMGATLTWEKGRQLKSYSKGNLSITYKYNTDGLRTEKNVNGAVYNYIWRGNKLVHQSGDNKNLHFYYDTTDSVVGFEYGGDKYTYIKNIQGDIVGILDESGNIVATYTYDACGNILTATGDLAKINPIRYRGYYYDDEIDMYYLQSRYYDPVVSRFISVNDFKNIFPSNVMNMDLLNLYSLHKIDSTLNSNSIRKKFKGKVSVILLKPNSEDILQKKFIDSLKSTFETEISYKIVSNSEEFKNAWNSLPDSDFVFIFCHGSPLELGDDKGTSLFFCGDTVELSYKKHKNLFLLACNAGEVNWSINVAICFKNKILGNVLASDGIVNGDMINNLVCFHSNFDNNFKGWVLYQNSINNQYTNISLPHGDDVLSNIRDIISYLIRDNYLII